MTSSSIPTVGLTEELKPCPFCGGKAEWGTRACNIASIMCSACGAIIEGPESRNYDAASASAVEAWSRRSPDALLRGSVAEHLETKRAERSQVTDAKVERAARALNPLMFELPDSPTKQSIREFCRATARTVLNAAEGSGS